MVQIPLMKCRQVDGVWGDSVCSIVVASYHIVNWTGMEKSRLLLMMIDNNKTIQATMKTTKTDHSRITNEQSPSQKLPDQGRAN